METKRFYTISTEDIFSTDRTAAHGHVVYRDWVFEKIEDAVAAAREDATRILEAFYGEDENGIQITEIVRPDDGLEEHEGWKGKTYTEIVPARTLYLSYEDRGEPEEGTLYHIWPIDVPVATS